METFRTVMIMSVAPGKVSEKALANWIRTPAHARNDFRRGIAPRDTSGQMPPTAPQSARTPGHCLLGRPCRPTTTSALAEMNSAYAQETYLNYRGRSKEVSLPW